MKENGSNNLFIHWYFILMSRSVNTHIKFPSCFSFVNCSCDYWMLTKGRRQRRGKKMRRREEQEEKKWTLNRHSTSISCTYMVVSFFFLVLTERLVKKDSSKVVSCLRTSVRAYTLMNCFFSWWNYYGCFSLISTIISFWDNLILNHHYSGDDDRYFV